MNQPKTGEEGMKKQKGRQIFFCPPCNMQFTTRKLFGIHLKKPSHVAKATSQPSRGAGNVAATTTNGKLGIYVKGYPPDTKETDLVKYFSQFGTVTWVHFGHDFLLMEFSESAAVERAMSKNGHFLHGRRLTVRYKDGVNVPVKVNDEATHQEIVASLVDSSDFEDEFERLLAKLQPNAAESFRKYNAICHDLYNLLIGRFPKLQVHPFGSTLTGLGFENSDIDVYLDNVKAGEEDEIPKLGQVKKILQQSGKFGNCFVIPGAKIPLIKCLHVRTGIKCDINVKNMLGVLNSRLIQYYLSLDLKVKKVMLILKFWAKIHKITGQNHLLTNYSLVMLFVFYLQQVYTFPTVISLQQFSKSDFVPNYNFHSDKLTSTSPLELLKGFFEFYQDFHFATVLISPYLGQWVFRAEVGNLPHFGGENEPINVTSGLAVQDPFELSKNITLNVSEWVLEQFVRLCQLGAKITLSNHQVIYHLLTEKPPEKVCFQGENLRLILTKTTAFTRNLSENEWFEFLDNFLTISLRDFLGMKVKLNSSEEGKRVYVCSSKVNLWHARKTTLKQLNLPVNLTLVDREWAVTSRLKESLPAGKDLPDILGFKLTISSGEEVVITTEKVNSFKTSHGKSFNVFFASNFPHWLASYEKDMAKAREEVS